VTTPTAAWHAADKDLLAYRAWACSPVLAASLETHLVRCGTCRASMGRLAGGDDTERRWARLADAVDRPSPSLLTRLGVTGGSDRGLVRATLATPAMKVAWAVSVLAVVLVPMIASLSGARGAPLLLMALAPLAPMAAVALAYREVADPAGEIALAASAAGVRLVAMRAAVASAPIVVLGLGTAILVDMPVPAAAAWLLPGAALAAVVLLAGTTRVDPAHVAVGLGALWAVAVASPARARDVAAVVDTLAGPAVQATALAIAVTAVLLTVGRRDLVAYRRTL
jgi:hypothetical protein